MCYDVVVYTFKIQVSNISHFNFIVIVILLLRVLIQTLYSTLYIALKKIQYLALYEILSLNLIDSI